MKLRCKLFGHKTPKGYGNRPPYFKISHTTIDGLGREHANLITECERCEKEFDVGKVHLPLPKADLNLNRY